MKRIAIVANTTWNIYNFRLNIIRKLIAEGYEVIVMAPVDKFITYTESIREVTHIPIKHLHRDSVNPLRDLKLLIELIRLYRKYKPDLILHYTIKPNIYGGIATRLLRIPSIAVVTGLGYSLIHEGWLNFITRRLYQFALPGHRKVIFENIDDQKLLKSKIWFLRRKQHRSKDVEWIQHCSVPMARSQPLIKLLFLTSGGCYTIKA